MRELILSLPNWYVMTVVLIFGLIIGSFLNVVALRGLSEESIVLPPSKCPKCKNKLKWYHNIPVLSYLFLRGKCAFCKEKISIQYPIVEALTGLSFLAIFSQYGFSWNTLFCFAFVAMIIVLSICDFREKVILTQHTYILAVLGLLYNFFNIGGGEGYTNFINGILGLILGFVFIMIVIKLVKMLTDKEAIGEGDAYILAAVGSVIGYKLVLLSFFVGIMFQALGVLPWLIASYFKSKKHLSLALMLIFGLLVGCYFYLKSLIATNNMLNWAYCLSLAASGLGICHLLMKDIKEGNYIQALVIPLGPAILFGGILTFIYQEQIVSFILSILRV